MRNKSFRPFTLFQQQLADFTVSVMLIIFDLDGTLLHTIDDLAAATNYAPKSCGFPLRRLEECRGFVGNGVTKLMERALPTDARTFENLEQMRRCFFSYYDEHLWEHTYPYEGITQTLQKLQARAVQLGVASNKYQAATERLINYFFPQISFVAVLGQRENVPPKPDAHIVQELVTAARETVYHTLYVGDSEVDMQTAQNAGVKVCAVTWGFRTRQELAVYHPDYLIEKPEELITLGVH